MEHHNILDTSALQTAIKTTASGTFFGLYPFGLEPKG
jgi:hypothetical protein